MKHKALKNWYTKASPKQKLFLANHLKIDRAYLHQIANGTRPITADKAILIESGTRLVNKDDPNMVVILQPEVCFACSHCPYTK